MISAKGTPCGRIRPGGRTEQVRQKVARAVLELLESGHVEFSYSDVAKRSGVHRTTLYRRWPQRTALVLEALELLNSGRLQVPDTGSWARDSVLLIAELARYFSSPAEMNMSSAILSDPGSDRHRAIIDLWRPLLDVIAVPVERAQQRGELSQAIDARILVQILINTMVMHTLVMQEPVPDDLVERLTTVFGALATAD